MSEYTICSSPNFFIAVFIYDIKSEYISPILSDSIWGIKFTFEPLSNYLIKAAKWNAVFHYK